MGVGSQRHASVTLPPRKLRYLLYRRLDGPQGRSKRVWKISPLPGFDTQTVQPVSSRYTNWATPAHICHLISCFMYIWGMSNTLVYPVPCICILSFILYPMFVLSFTLYPMFVFCHLLCTLFLCSVIYLIPYFCVLGIVWTSKAIFCPMFTFTLEMCGLGYSAKNRLATLISQEDFSLCRVVPLNYGVDQIIRSVP
jgi:hypothetical protein